MGTEPRGGREPEAKGRILRAAIAEYAERGRAGVRIEHVAARASVNKALVYRYFGDRDALFDAAMREVFSSRLTLLEDLPDTLEGTMKLWAERFRRDPMFLRMIVREAIEGDPSRPAERTLRREYYRRQIDQVAGFQASGELPREADPEYLFLALLGLLAVPMMLPQIARLVSGRGPEGRAFSEGWDRAIAAVAGALREGD